MSGWDIDSKVTYVMLYSYEYMMYEYVRVVHIYNILNMYYLYVINTIFTAIRYNTL